MPTGIGIARRSWHARNRSGLTGTSQPRRTRPPSRNSRPKPASHSEPEVAATSRSVDHSSHRQAAAGGGRATGSHSAWRSRTAGAADLDGGPEIPRRYPRTGRPTRRQVRRMCRSGTRPPRRSPHTRLLAGARMHLLVHGHPPRALALAGMEYEGDYPEFRIYGTIKTYWLVALSRNLGDERAGRQA